MIKILVGFPQLGIKAMCASSNLRRFHVTQNSKITVFDHRRTALTTVDVWTETIHNKEKK